MSLDAYFLISWRIDDEEVTKNICKEYLKSCDKDEDEHMIEFLNSIIYGKSTFEGSNGTMYVWCTVGNYGVLYDDDLIPLFKKLYESDAINPFNNVIILNQTGKSYSMMIAELSYTGKEIEIRENYDNDLTWCHP